MIICNPTDFKKELKRNKEMEPTYNLAHHCYAPAESTEMIPFMVGSGSHPHKGRTNKKLRPGEMNPESRGDGM